MLHASFSRIYIFSLPPEKSNFADEIWGFHGGDYEE
jgi:hypothetical protein